VGLGGNPDVELDLDSGPLPFADGEFETVLCLDVLEHLENIHFMFDELCRVSSQHVIVSLPNCLGHLWRCMTRFGMETEQGLLKYYGLPDEPPADRHRWFFDAVEAEQFVRKRADKNGCRVTQLDVEQRDTTPRLRKRFLLNWARRIILHQDIDYRRLSSGSVWAVIAKH
jgi:ubiquinone/menaquinone biosynthesis C-methylase UbiE